MKLKKWCSLFLAFCMLAASISFPSSAEGESGSAPVFSEDFEGRGEGTSIATGNGWTVNTQTHGSLTVSRNNNNQMLEFALSENDTANPRIQKRGLSRIFWWKRISGECIPTVWYASHGIYP